MTRVREIARRVSNWGRWGADDERGTVNFITPDVVCRAAACVRRGTVFSLGLLFGADGPQIGQGGRTNPVHTVTAIDGRLGANPDGPRYADDAVSMPLQCATQWDSLAHVYYDGRLYNGVPASTLGAAGATRNAIDKLARGIVSRGVLLDLARARGVERLRAGDVIPYEDPAVPLPVHALCIRDMGLTLGEMFDLDELAADSARDGVWEFLFSAPPLKVAGGIGSPLNPLAVK